MTTSQQAPSLLLRHKKLFLTVGSASSLISFILLGLLFLLIKQVASVAEQSDAASRFGIGLATYSIAIPALFLSRVLFVIGVIGLLLALSQISKLNRSEKIILLFGLIFTGITTYWLYR